jgi:hypothetical protein
MMFVQNTKGLFGMKKLCYVLIFSVFLLSFSAVGHAAQSIGNVNDTVVSGVEEAIKMKRPDYVENSFVVLDSIKLENEAALFVEYATVRDNFFYKTYKEVIFYDTVKNQMVLSVKGKEAAEFMNKYKADLSVKVSHIPLLLMLGACGLLLYFVLYTTTSRSSFLPKL